MQTLTTISLIINAAFIFLFLSVFLVKGKQVYTQYKTKREKQFNDKIEKIVIQYLKHLQDDSTDGI